MIHHPKLHLGEAIDVLANLGVPDNMIKHSLRQVVLEGGEVELTVMRHKQPQTERTVCLVKYDRNLFDIVCPQKELLN